MMRVRLSNQPISWFFPPTCVLCGAPGDAGRDLCAGCDADLPRNRICCARCALPFESPVPSGTLCGRCQKREPPFDRCMTAFRYEAEIPSLVGGAKFEGRLNLVRLLGQCLAVEVNARGLSMPHALVPVPLHPRRLRERGYNQALEIARVLGRELALEVDPDCCTRIAATPPQARLDARARRRNLRRAFSAREPFGWSHVAIVDDVVTTASTIVELSRVLRRAGAERIDVWAVARTP
ncbi:phosphoribosyltransferase [Thiorhodococcus drewsii AZ1]|uniref:Phosphoribosyltransferase n=1 Tax=Thiorhodococcus drewsii AZ1 TaxID=765913 RepID=G2E069_9GAMM|nr:ComF family protein [Thiorhodococcus drewsii]EGV31797.1 phosphoribosyltransferase [Thiorhodococcus drewsii AZ1]